jgi:hypothetical protein
MNMCVREPEDYVVGLVEDDLKGVDGEHYAFLSTEFEFKIEVLLLLGRSTVR